MYRITSPNSTLVTEHIHGYLYQYAHNHVVQVFSLCQGVCKQLQYDGDDNVVSVIKSEV